MKFSNQFAIAGFGMTEVGYHEGRSGRLYQAEAARLAIADAGLNAKDIDGSIGCRVDAGRMGIDYTDAFPRILGLPVNFYFTLGRGGAMVPLAIVSAAKFLELGIATYIVIAFGLNQFSMSRSSDLKGPPMIDKLGSWGYSVGDVVAASQHSLFASRHMHEFGTKEEHFGAVVVSERRWACLNPRAQRYGQPLTLEDYLATPYLISPYRKHDFAQLSDGGVAFVLTTAERAKDAKKPIYVAGVGFGEQMQSLWWEKKNYTEMAVKTAKEAAFRQAGITLQDIDVALLYDCFPAEVIIQLEDYGWCEKGQGGPYVASGAIAPGGKLPVNTGGGLLSGYNLVDFTGFSEAMFQLRGEAGERQVKDAEIALVTGHGGEILRPGMCSIHSTLILRREC